MAKQKKATPKTTTDTTTEPVTNEVAMTPEELELEVTELKEANATLEATVTEQAATIVEMDKAAQASGNLEEITAKVNMLEELIVEKDEQIESLEANVAKLSDTAQTKAGKVIALPVVSVDGKQYQVTMPQAFYKGVKVTAQDLQDDEDLAAELIGIRSGMLKAL